MRGLLTFVALQVGWFACVLGGARENVWIGPLVVAVLILGHLVSFAWPRRNARSGKFLRHEIVTLLSFGLAGTFADSLQSGLGLLAFHGSPSSGPGVWLAPPWIAALWFHFGTVLTGPLAPLRDRRLLTVALCLVAAPLSYAGGGRLGAVAFHPAGWPSVLSIGLVWTTILSLALRWAVPPRSPEGPESQTRAPGWAPPMEG
ncbi:MAG TPA: DUF2878 domain-containing protein [Thermoanaerobaculia bacterium]|nr:DUF2878 domain-containing protein [Thermoanaerobaculia bacterium]